MVTIRKMTIADYDAIYKIWVSTPGMGLNDVDDSREGIAKYLERNPNTCFVAVDDAAEGAGAIAGAIMAGHDGRRGIVQHTVVSEKYQRRGVGSQLVEKALEALKAEGISKVFLVVFARNEKGNRFWQKCGFTTRDDLVYRNKALVSLVRLDT